jgi:hypothetical protein
MDLAIIMVSSPYYWKLFIVENVSLILAFNTLFNLENNNSIKALDNFNYFSINPLFFEY